MFVITGRQGGLFYMMRHWFISRKKTRFASNIVFIVACLIVWSLDFTDFSSSSSFYFNDLSEVMQHAA